MGKTKLALGTVQLGMPYGIANRLGQPDRLAVFNILETASLHGVTAWDTSPVYGESETLIGQFIASNQGTYQISSKLPSLTKDSQQTHSSSDLYAVVEKRLRKSLETLNLNQLDTYFLHDEQDFVTYGTELLEVLSGLKTGGLIRGAGISVYSLGIAMDVLETKLLDAIQLPFNLFDQRFLPVISLAQENGVAIFARSIFLQGLFFLSPSEAELKVPQAGAFVKNLQLLTEKTNRSMAELALCYVRDTLGISYVITGVDTNEQLRNNLHLFSCPEIQDWERAEISKLFSQIPLNVVNPTLW